MSGHPPEEPERIVDPDKHFAVVMRDGKSCRSIVG